MMTALMMLGAIAAQAAPATPPAARSAPAQPAPAQSAPIPTPPPAPQAPQDPVAQQDQILKAAGMSDAGIATMRTAFESVRTGRDAAVGREEAGQLELIAALRTKPLDVDRVTKAMKANDALTVSRLNARTDATLNAIRALSPADREIMARMMSATQAAANTPRLPPPNPNMGMGGGAPAKPAN